MSARSIVALAMVHVHEIPRELADYHVAQMGEDELCWRFLKYMTMELSAAGPTNKSCPDFYQVFGSATTHGRPAALDCIVNAGVGPAPSMPESEIKNLVRGPRRVLPRLDFRPAGVGNKKPGMSESGTQLSGEGFWF